MRRIAFGIITALAIAPVLWADEPPKDKPKDAAKADKEPATPAEQYQSLVKEFTKARQDFSKEYQQAKTQEERNQLYKEKYPQPAKYAAQMMEIAEKNPKDAVAIDALIWVVTNVRYGPEANKALDLLVQEHIDSPKLGTVAATLVYSSSNQSEKLLRTILEKSPHRDVQGMACFSLGQYLKNQAANPRGAQANAEKLRTEVEALFERVIKEFGSVKSYRSSLGEQAKSELFELRYLAIGKKAPDITGEDLDGQPFKLSDYMGKVVVLDFWGNW